VKLDGIDVTNRLVGNVLTLSNLADDAILEAFIGVMASVSTPAYTTVGDQETYTVTLSNMKGAGTVTLSLTANGNNLVGNATALGGFTILDQRWESVGGGEWKGTFTLMYPGFATNAGSVDVLKISGTAGNLGSKTAKLSDLAVAGNVNGMSGYLSSAIVKAEATTVVVSKVPVYSKYDLNRDGAVDILDTNIAVYFYLKNSGGADWAVESFNGRAPKDADVNNNGIVNLADLIEIMANYGPYNVYP
jgi:hypothetical protein